MMTNRQVLSVEEAAEFAHKLIAIGFRREQGGTPVGQELAQRYFESAARIYDSCRVAKLCGYRVSIWQFGHAEWSSQSLSWRVVSS